MMPNFLIIGAAKSGTTTLYHYLKQHPQVYMTPIKETNFFAFKGKKPSFTGVKINESTKSYQRELIIDINSYRQQFSSVKNEIAIGESCPSYLYISSAAKNIKSHSPDIKLIIILRDPMERAYSNFLHHVREKTEYYDSFLEAIAAESKRIEDGWWWGFHYVQVGLYYKQIKKYFDLFDRSQIKIYLFDRFKKEPSSTINDIFNFIGVKPVDNLHQIEKHNKTGIPANIFLDDLIKGSGKVKKLYQALLPNKNVRKQLTAKISSLNPLVKPKLSNEIRQELLLLFSKDIYMLQELINEDLSFWLK